jgi:hypothetical protein
MGAGEVVQDSIVEGGEFGGVNSNEFDLVTWPPE